MRFTRLGWLSAFVVGTIVLIGCSSPAPEPSSDPTAAAISSTETCEQVSDVGTLVLNLGNTHREGRLSDLEWVGVEQLAARLLDNVPAEPGTRLSHALGDLQEIISRPVDALITVDVESEEWYDAWQAFDRACQDTGYPFGVYGWVGG
jgi:hypothetical protein